MSALIVVALAGCRIGHPAETIEADMFMPSTCQVGIYELADSFVAITRRDDVFSYAFSDGRRGKIKDQSSISCGKETLRLDGADLWARKPLEITDTQFDAGGIKLAGQLLEAKDAGPDTTLVVLAHGSEELGWIEAVAYPYQFVGRGVSVFVYDKRGTGQSDGSYSQNFPQLADDLVAASREAKRLAEDRFGRFGLFGFSQGGWIAPLAAERSGADFIGIGYGLLVDILEEDASQVELEMREAGFGDDVVSKAKAITDVTARLAVSNYSDGLEELDALRDQYRDESWYGIIRGGFTGVILGLSTTELREKGIPMFDRLNIDWSVNPMDVLREVNLPQLWVLAAEDREAPMSKTLARLASLRREGSDITIYVFPNTDHGMWKFEQAPDRTRTRTRVVDSYYELLGDWAKGSLKPPYNDSVKK
ncbi:MAG: alpha/beta hydrolase [Woeseiaceae bacterium]